LTTPSNSTSAGVYIHWPFCARKCPYCDFYSFGREHEFWDRNGDYLEALTAEIATAPERLDWSAPPRVDTIYFGGGTPGLMGPAALEKVLRALGKQVIIDSDPEITLEINPTKAEADDLKAYVDLGVNRVSVGVQSFSDRILENLGRIHDSATARGAIEHARQAGVVNLSIDLIFGAPGQEIENLRADLAQALAFSPEHISAYGLTIHEGTPFAPLAAAGKLNLPDEETHTDMFEFLMDALGEAGYEHYEISNWARPGRASRHNSKYWREADVFGFGVAAHGVQGGRRTANSADLNDYLNLPARRLAEPLPPPSSERARRGEVMMLALRRVGGVAWEEIDRWMGGDALAFYKDEFAGLSLEGLLWFDDQCVRLTRRGILVADGVTEAFF
jgi:oxygen-independent coproporphyrinogen III oxidase